MLFNSAVFVFAFLPLAVLAYFGLCKLRWTSAAQGWLVLSSLFFYGYWNPQHLPVLLGSLLINFLIGSELSKGHDRESRHSGLTRSALLTVGISGNLITLGYFKYANFFVSNVEGLIGFNIELAPIALPLAISFFTFQQIAYLVDSHRGHTREYDFLRYTLFITFFPQLIAGPIVHHREMMPQFASPRSWVFRHQNMLQGLMLFGVGLFKKVLLADPLSTWASAGFDGQGPLDFFEAWGASLAYTFQLYFDFSGYCDMAAGAALMFNIRLPQNFNSPYKARDIQDFWRRWHITLGRFLRDYLYIPLGGNQHPEPRVAVNLMVTFVLGGLWHGPSWLFVIWGTLHGLALVVHRQWRKLGGHLPAPAAWALTFLFVNFAWVFFRATTLDNAWRMLSAMTQLSHALSIPIEQIATAQLAWGGTLIDALTQWLPPALVAQLPVYAALTLCAALLPLPNAQRMSAMPVGTAKMVFCSAALAAGLLGMFASKSSVFLYFNF